MMTVQKDSAIPQPMLPSQVALTSLISGDERGTHG
jgi:hypothetical protein